MTNFNSVTVILSFGNHKHCFLNCVESFQGPTPQGGRQDDQIQIYEAEAGHGQKVYFSVYGRKVMLRSGDTVEINGLYAEKLSLKDGDPLSLWPINSTVQTARKVHMEPLSADDWEILEKNAGRVETVLLDQIRVTWPGQILPVWVQKSICIFMQILTVEPMSSCVLLDVCTEVIVAPKMRAYPPKTLGIPDHQKMPCLRSRHQPSPTSWQKNTEEVTDTLEPRPSNRSPVRSPRVSQKKSSLKVHRNILSNSDPLSDRKEALRPQVLRQSSLLDSVKRYFLPFMDKKEDTDDLSDSDAGSANFFMQDLQSRNAVLRVQPMKLSCTLEESVKMEEIRSSSSNKAVVNSFFTWKTRAQRQAAQDEWREAQTSKIPMELFQTSTVYVDIEYMKTERLLHPHLPDLPPVFIAQLIRLPSPREKEEAAQQKVSKHTKGGLKDDSGSQGKGAGDHVASETPEKSEPGGFNGSCYVRVVVIDRNAGLTDKAWQEAADRLLSEQALMYGHVIVPDMLRRQLKLDATGSVWLKTGPVNIVSPRKICIYTLSSVPRNWTNEIMVMAFRSHVRLCASSDHPLVIFQGLFLQYTVFPGTQVDVQITFYDENDTANPHALSLLSEFNIDTVHVMVIKNTADDTMGVVCPKLMYTVLSDFDPIPPKVRLKHLGGVDSLIKQALTHLHESLSARPLSRYNFPSRTGLNHGILLITGPKGCGKTSLAKALCRKMHHLPVMAYILSVDCKDLRGKTVSNIQKLMESVFDEAAWREPSVVLFDNLDVILPAPSGPETEMNGESLYSAKNSQVLQSLIKYEVENNSYVTVIATSKSRSSLHPGLVSSRGVHFIQFTVNIGSPDKVAREKILTSILTNHNSISMETVHTLNLGALAAKTEGFVARDLVSLVNRVLHSKLVMDSEAFNGKITITSEDFEDALSCFKPVSVRNVALHKPGDLVWEDVGGLDDVKTALIETLRWPTKYPQLFSSCPLRLRSGVLLYGAPGTGKTLLAGVLAKECGLNFISIKGPELLSKYIGASEQAVRDLFDRAQSVKPCILFFDEFDSIAPKRGHDSTGVTDRVVNQLLTQLDGVEGLQGVYVLGATSRPDLLDPALLRPGRLDKCLNCGLPNEDERTDILVSITRKMTLAYDVDLAEISKLCPHFTGADLKALLYNAQLMAIHEGADSGDSMDCSVVRIKGDDAKSSMLRRASVILDDAHFPQKLNDAVGKANDSLNTSLTEEEPNFSLEPPAYDRREAAGWSKTLSEDVNDIVSAKSSQELVMADGVPSEDMVDGFLPNNSISGEDIVDGSAFYTMADAHIEKAYYPMDNEQNNTANSETPNILPSTANVEELDQQHSKALCDMGSLEQNDKIAIRISESSNPDDEFPSYPNPANTYPPTSSKRKRYCDRAQSYPEGESSSQLTIANEDQRHTSPSMDRPVTVIASLERGMTTLSSEDEARYISMVNEIQRRADRMFEAANNQRRHSLQVASIPTQLLEVCQRHLVEAATSMKPSVSPQERERYLTIYENFVSSRKGTFGHTQELAVGKRATLA